VSKKKRVRRDIEKFVRVGRYWDLLRLLEDEDLVSDHAREHKEAWKAVTRQALRQETAFDRFCREVGTLKSLPNDPDFRFLMGIREYAEGKRSAEAVLELDGLSPDAERLRSNFSAFASSAMNPEKLRGLLEKFIREPDKITRRHFEQAAGLIPMAALGSRAGRMGESIALARRFNQKAAVARGWNGIDIGRLEMLDSRLLSVSQPLPQALREVLLHPFVHNIAVMCRRLAPDAGSNRAAQLIGAIPFLLPRLAEEKLQDIERKFLIDRGEWINEGGNDPNALRRKVDGLGIEEKLSLLNGMRIRVADRAPKEPDLFGDLDFFGDAFEDDDDELLEDETSKATDPAQALLVLYTSILEDISGRLPELTPRERKELVRVMEPILFRDLGYILDAMESREELMDLLDAGIGAGCAGTRMGLLAVLAGAQYRNGNLRKRAEKLLDESAAPTQQDMEWIAREWSDLYYPSVRSLKPFLVRYKDEKNLLKVFTDQLCSMLELSMVESVLETELLGGLPAALTELFGAQKLKEPGTLRREMAALTEYEVLDPVRYFLRCYPDDRLTVDGHLCRLNALHSSHRGEVWGYALEELRRYGKLMDAGNIPLLPVKGLKTLAFDRIEAVLLFMKEHLDELTTLSLDALGPLLDELLEYPEALLAHHTLLIHLEKLLAERIKAGEKTAQPLMNRIKATLQKLAKPKNKTYKPRRKSKR
jgi:hypothetical protein